MANMEPMMKFTLPKFDTPNQILIKQKKVNKQIKTKQGSWIILNIQSLAGFEPSISKRAKKKNNSSYTKETHF